MSSTLSELRAAAEPYKSFPKAVAAVVRAMFDRGTSWIVISFSQLDRFGLTVACSDRVFKENEMSSLIANSDHSPTWSLAFVHHASGKSVVRTAYNFIGLGQGEGVNAKQDRSAKRLVRELPRLLSPREALQTVLIDEAGKEHRLVKNLSSTTIDGFRISWPKKMIGFEREGLILKCGIVRVPMATFLARSQMVPEERECLNILTHPWLQGVVEVECVEESGYVNFQSANRSSDNFDDEFYLQGHAVTLGRALMKIVPAVVLRKMNKTVMADLGDFCQADGGLVLGGHTYRIACADEHNLPRPEHTVLVDITPPNQGNRHELLVNLTHEVFRTISPDLEEIMQVLWWQLAIWIATDPSSKYMWWIPDLSLRATRIYLGLRAQNPERND